MWTLHATVLSLSLKALNPQHKAKAVQRSKRVTDHTLQSAQVDAQTSHLRTAGDNGSRWLPPS